MVGRRQVTLPKTKRAVIIPKFPEDRPSFQVFSHFLLDWLAVRWAGWFSQPQKWNLALYLGKKGLFGAGAGEGVYKVEVALM